MVAFVDVGFELMLPPPGPRAAAASCSASGATAWSFDRSSAAGRGAASAAVASVVAALVATPVVGAVVAARSPAAVLTTPAPAAAAGGAQVADVELRRLAVQVDHGLVDVALIVSFLADELGSDLLDDGVNGVLDALAEVAALVAVTTLDRLEGARRGTRRDSRALVGAVVEEHDGLDRGVAARVKDLASADAFNGCHRTLRYTWLIRAAGLITRVSVEPNEPLGYCRVGTWGLSRTGRASPAASRQVGVRRSGVGVGVLSVVDAPEVITEGRGVQARQRGGERDARVDSEATGLHDEVEQRRPDLRWPMPVDLVQVLTGARVTAALKRLPDRQREAIVLCHYQELSNIEAAALMDISVEALESLLSRGRRALRQALSDLVPGAAKGDGR